MKHNHSRVRTLAICISLNLFAGACLAQAPDGRSLQSCVSRVSKEAQKYMKARTKLVGKCFERLSRSVIQDNNTQDLDSTARSCISTFRKLENSGQPSSTLRSRFLSKLKPACDPSANPGIAHTVADVIGTGATATQPIKAENLDEWCALFGGDGAINSVDEWLECQVQALDRDSDQSTALAFPRALEWVLLLRPVVVAQDPEDANDTNPAGPDRTVQDALAVLDALRLSLDGNDDDVLGPPCDDDGTGGGPGGGDPDADFEDKQDGTILQISTGLRWAKKDDKPATSLIPTVANIHSRQNLILWSGPQLDLQDGDLTVSEVLWAMNHSHCTNSLMTFCYTDAQCTQLGDPSATCSAGFAGFSDWRLPTIQELFSIRDPESGQLVTAFRQPCTANCLLVDGCSCAATTTQSYPYWSSTPATFGSDVSVWAMRTDDLVMNTAYNLGHGGAIGGVKTRHNVDRGSLLAVRP